MSLREIKPGIYHVGVQHWDRRLFDALIPTPEGTSYNSYLLKGNERTVLVDSVDPELQEELIRELKGHGVEKLDHIVSHHAEQDHSGGIVRVLEEYPEATVVTNAKNKVFLMEHLLIPEEKFQVVAEGDTLDLGNWTMEFIMAPWVHWPETMFSYLKEERVLFTCDFLGSHLATSDLFVEDEREVYLGAKRYYAEIMMPFRHLLPKYIERIRGMEVDIVAPSHGPLHKDPAFMLDSYEEWATGEVKNEVLLVYVSMHGSTKRMIEHLEEALIERDIRVKVFNLEHTDVGELAMALVDAATLVLGTPTVLTGPHPLAAYAAILANALRPKLKFATIIGSYGWGGKAVEGIQALVPNLQVELIDPILVKGHPKEEDLAALDAMADAIVEKHTGAGLI